MLALKHNFVQNYGTRIFDDIFQVPSSAKSTSFLRCCSTTAHLIKICSPCSRRANKVDVNIIIYFTFLNFYYFLTLEKIHPEKLKIRLLFSSFFMNGGENKGKFTQIKHYFAIFWFLFGVSGSILLLISSPLTFSLRH